MKEMSNLPFCNAVTSPEPSLPLTGLVCLLPRLPALVATWNGTLTSRVRIHVLTVRPLLKAPFSTDTLAEGDGGRS